jgi:hypothetical protein
MACKRDIKRSHTVLGKNWAILSDRLGYRRKTLESDFTFYAERPSDCTHKNHFIAHDLPFAKAINHFTANQLALFAYGLSLVYNASNKGDNKKN